MTARTVITSSAAAYLTGHLSDGWGLADYAGDFAEDFDLASAEADYVAIVEEALAEVRPDWVICGQQIIGDYPAELLTEDEATAVAAAIAAIDLGKVLARHDLRDEPEAFRIATQHGDAQVYWDTDSDPDNPGWVVSFANGGQNHLTAQVDAERDDALEEVRRQAAAALKEFGVLSCEAR